ncbi:methylated-DNA--[protein]-cysteine S-methyltransferase [Corynebacterium bovis]|uniref:methylated-DNA--[protein]-cysteine S-methyltransferase n=1 Tax=Corynebacterium bovis TaxID=36808 RepID=UPI00313A0E4C
MTSPSYRSPAQGLTVTVSTPDGAFTVIVGHQGASTLSPAVLAAGWVDTPEPLLPLIHPDLRPTSLQRGVEDPVLRDAADAVRAYYGGDLLAPASIPVTQRSGGFRERAWRVLRDVPPGEPVTYAGFARMLGSSRAVRASAGACASNAAALFVPCHRVLRSDGTVGGFRYGTPVKQSLLDREAGAR